MNVKKNINVSVWDNDVTFKGHCLGFLLLDHDWLETDGIRH